ncbi:MAG TPA: sulfite oxidase [Solirubrobacteraceae bacterium]|jgi:DMSO/TMAO reductase YedYZ molybdopterin-dependent catalytic subunit|nr:sulfite oxidase [Solirubrobacteraceae bacterium]
MAVRAVAEQPVEQFDCAIPVADVADATPLSALLIDEMPLGAHFRRDHYPAPALDSASWSLEVGGAVRRPLCLDVAQLRRLGAQTERVVLECAGHRRSEYEPAVPGLTWAEGAVGEARWTGAPLAAILERAGVLPTASVVVLEGADAGPFAGRDGSHPFARGLPLDKARAPETMLVWEVNGAPIDRRHGGPVRAIVPGWYATDSVKWLTRITILEGEFDGPWEVDDYRLLPAGDKGPGERMTTMPVHALVVEPCEDSGQRPGPATARGVAWGGEGGIALVEMRIDGGPWRRADLGPSRGAYARRFWKAPWIASAGRHRIEVRATDATGRCQPEQVRWNQRGYANNAVHGAWVSVDTD